MAAAVNYVEMPEPDYGLHRLPHLGDAVLQILLPDEVKILREEPITPWSGPPKKIPKITLLMRITRATFGRKC